MEQRETKLGLLGLIAIVVGGVIGGGIFNISKLLAEGAGLGAILISWVISGTGILSIALTFTTLNAVWPELSRGIYMYAHTGFGRYAGFNIAWGYWIGTVLGNVVFSIMLNDAFGLFFPVLLNHSWPTLIFASCWIWIFALVVLFGLRVASVINTISTFIKFSSLLLIIALLLRFADYDLLKWDFWGKQGHLGSVFQQVNSTLLTTLFFFMGIEGAIVISFRARKTKDVGKATIIGYLICLFLNVMVCILSFGMVTQAEMVHLNDPALSQIVGRSVGEWGRIFVNLSVIIAVAGAWLVCTIIVAELPAQAAKDRVLPRFFEHYNKRGTPVRTLLISSCLIQLFLFLVLREHNVYIFTVKLSGIMVLPTYVLSAMFLVKSGWKKKIYLRQTYARRAAIGYGAAAACYCLWVIVAGNVRLLLLSSAIYLAGTFFYRFMIRQYFSGQRPVFVRKDWYVIATFVVSLGIYFVWAYHGKAG